jgi:hypothetical protein
VTGTGEWTCDTCGEIIKSVEDGWVEWVQIRQPDGTARGRNLRLVHRAPASPRRPNGTCQFDQRAEFRRDGGTVGDASLDEYVGADGLVTLLEMISDQRAPTEEVLTLIQRLHVPGYEQARHHFDAAISEGVFEPNTKPGYYRVSEIDKVLKWLRERKS